MDQPQTDHVENDNEQVPEPTNNIQPGFTTYIPTVQGQVGVNVSPGRTGTVDKPSLKPLSIIHTEYGTDSKQGVPKSENSQAGWGSRHVFALMGFLGLTSVYAMRVNLSVAIVDMVISQPKENQTYANKSSDLFCPFGPDYDNNATDDGEFDWDGHTQGMILGCFYWGYIVTQIPGGILAAKFGGKLLFGWGVFLTCIFNILSPIAARIHVALFIAVRVLLGVGEGVTYPALHDMISRWVPPSERSRIGAFVLAGTQFGTVVSMPMSGALASVPLDNGWPLAFYVPGVMGLVWCLGWYFLVFDNPSSHPRISAKEKEYILTYVPHVERENSGKTPWKTILTSIHLWAILVAQMGQSWGFYMLLTELPTYMKSVLHFDLGSNSALSALPYLAMWIFGNLSSWFADYLRSHKGVTTTIVRKSFNTFGEFKLLLTHVSSIGFLGFLLPGLLLIGAGYSGCDRTLTVTLLTLALGCNGAVYSGFLVNHIDVASNYAGIIMGINNSAATICGFLAPYIVSTITNEGTLSQWRMVFFISAAVYFSANLFFVIFGTGEEQPWNRKHLNNPDGSKSVQSDAVKQEDFIS